MAWNRADTSSQSAARKTASKSPSAVKGATTSVVAAQLIISQVCNGHRRSGFGYYWEFPHCGRPITLAMRRKRV